MRIDELKRIAEENDYEYSKVIWNHRFARKNSDNYITINGDYINRIWTSIQGYCDDKDFNMIKASIEFAETPPDDREEIKKYFYKHNSMKTKGGNPTYLAIRQRPSISYPVLQGSSEDIFEYKVEFTDEEIKKAENEHGISLDDFEKNEVKDDQK